MEDLTIEYSSALHWFLLLLLLFYYYSKMASLLFSHSSGWMDEFERRIQRRTGREGGRWITKTALISLTSSQQLLSFFLPFVLSFLASLLSATSPSIPLPVLVVVDLDVAATIDRYCYGGATATVQLKGFLFLFSYFCLLPLCRLGRSFLP